MRVSSPATFLVALVIVLAACSDSVVAPTSASPESSESTTTTAVPVTTAPPETTATTAVPVTTAPPESTTTTAAPTTTITLPAFPPPRQSLEHGGETWVVILAGATDFTDPVLDEAIEAAADAGYTTGPTDCDLGAAKALGMSEETLFVSVSVYFETEEDAQAALVAFEARGESGVVATVFTFCLD